MKLLVVISSHVIWYVIIKPAQKLAKRFCLYGSDSRRKQNKQISLANQGLTRSFHWSRAISKTSFFSFFEFLTHLQFFGFKIILTEKFCQTFRI